MNSCHIFIEDNPILGVLSQAEYRVLYACIKLSWPYDDCTLRRPGCQVLSNSAECELMADITKLNVRTIKNTMAELRKAGILLKEKGTRGVYYLNPTIAYKGDNALYKKLIDKNKPPRHSHETGAGTNQNQLTSIKNLPKH